MPAQSKPPGLRARRNAPATVTTIPRKGRNGRKPPPWPLRPDNATLIEQQTAEQQAERLREKINAATDGRVIRRHEKELDQALARASVLELQIAEQAAAEQQLWAELWKTPQASLWETNGWTREVALFVRHQLIAEQNPTDYKAATAALARSDRLGLTPLAMSKLKWQIEQADEAEDRGTRRRSGATPAKAPPRTPAKDPRGILHRVK